MQKEMATHSSTLAWKIPWTGSLVGYNLWVHRVGHTEGLPLHFLNLIKSTQRTELPLLVITGQVWMVLFWGSQHGGNPMWVTEATAARVPTPSCQAPKERIPTNSGQSSFWSNNLLSQNAPLWNLPWPIYSIQYILQCTHWSIIKRS